MARSDDFISPGLRETLDSVNRALMAPGVQSGLDHVFESFRPDTATATAIAAANRQFLNAAWARPGSISQIHQDFLSRTPIFDIGRTISEDFKFDVLSNTTGLSEALRPLTELNGLQIAGTSEALKKLVDSVYSPVGLTANILAPTFTNQFKSMFETSDVLQRIIDNFGGQNQFAGLLDDIASAQSLLESIDYDIFEDIEVDEDEFTNFLDQHPELDDAVAHAATQVRMSAPIDRLRLRFAILSIVYISLVATVYVAFTEGSPEIKGVVIALLSATGMNPKSAVEMLDKFWKNREE